MSDSKQSTMKNDITVHSWVELQSALYDIPKVPQLDRYRSDFVFRGVGDKSWGLETSLQRIGSHYAEVEGPLLRSFVKYAAPGNIPSDELFFRLALAQHHGLPTRVLDWTTSPKVAAHFATYEEQYFDKDGVIWCIDVARTRSLLPNTLKAKLAKERAFVFSIEMLARYKTLAQFNLLTRKKKFILFFEPPSLDGRIVSQGAILSISPDPRLDLKEFLETYDHLYKRIIIPKKLKWELRDKLDQDNVSERMLFPGLDGTSRWLKRYYGLGPRGPDARLNVPAPASGGRQSASPAAKAARKRARKRSR